MAQAGSQAALGLGAAAVWGAADFSGGLATQRAAPAVVVALAHAFSLLLLFAVALPLNALHAHHSPYGFASGVLCGTGLIALYAALSRGSMGLAAAVSGVLTALVPVAYSLVLGALRHAARPSALQLIGFALAAVAIWLIAYAPGKNPTPSREPSAATGSRTILLAVLAGLCFGGMLILMHLAAPFGALQSLIDMRWMSLSIAAIASVPLWLVRGRSPALFPAGRALLLALLAGVLDTTGNLLYLFAAVHGRLDVTAVLAALYPAGTMLLAAWLLKERASKSQTAGMALAIAAIVFILM